jgi:DNA-directed RNA polymerase subunit M/transcription elongation factor TFIIS
MRNPREKKENRMIQCPKCGSLRISEPRYKASSPNKEECLVYTCQRCGYREEWPCHDAKEFDNAKQ